MRVFFAILRFGLAALLVYAGVMKLLAPADFADEIVNYRLIPALAPYLAASLPTVEIVCGLVLALGTRAWRAGAALATLVLLAFFTGAVTSVWLRGIDVRCGCFGSGSGLIDGVTVARDVVLVAVASIGLWNARRGTATI